MALADVDSTRAANTFQKFDKAVRYTDCRKMLDKEERNLDAVIVATPDHMHATAAPGARIAAEIVWSGEIGNVTEGHAWTNRPVWPQGIESLRKEEPVPSTLDWDVWLGPGRWVTWLATSWGHGRAVGDPIRVSGAGGVQFSGGGRKKGGTGMLYISVAAPFTEWILLGCIALHFEGKLEWDSARMRFTNNAEANQYVKPKVRKGWQFTRVA